jgi:hypothetical protein
MKPVYRYLGSFVLSAAVISSMGCASRSRVRVYDPYRSDYHRWDRRETVYYNQWVIEGRRDNRDYKHLNQDEQRRYWEWRHQHQHDHDHDRDDRDRDHDRDHR